MEKVRRYVWVSSKFRSTLSFATINWGRKGSRVNERDPPSINMLIRSSIYYKIGAPILWIWSTTICIDQTACTVELTICLQNDSPTHSQYKNPVNISICKIVGIRPHFVCKCGEGQIRHNGYYCLFNGEKKNKSLSSPGALQVFFQAARLPKSGWHFLQNLNAM